MSTLKSHIVTTYNKAKAIPFPRLLHKNSMQLQQHIQGPFTGRTYVLDPSGALPSPPASVLRQGKIRMYGGEREREERSNQYCTRGREKKIRSPQRHSSPLNPIIL